MELNFEVIELDTRRDFEPLPAGWYGASIFETEEKISKAGNKYLNVTFEITNADHAGRRVWQHYNVYYPDLEKQARARQECHKLSTALGFANIPANSEDMLDIHLDILLKIEEGSGGYGPKNKVTGYRSAPSPKPPVANTAPLPKAANGDLDGPDW